VKKLSYVVGALALLVLVSLAGCSDTHEVLAPHDDDAEDAGEAPNDASADAANRDAGDEGDAGTDAGAGDAGAGAGDAGRDSGGDDEDGGRDVPPEEPEPTCEEQIEDALDQLPDDLKCTGLYADVERKIIADDMRYFAPAVPLWSDGSGKQRWVYLPEGTVIDASDPDEWVFPVGTKFFKEFRVNGRRVETRIFQKLREDRWARATYEWDERETRATRSFGSTRDDVTIAGKSYVVPTGRECDQCHGGREDRSLGFEAISLGLPGAQGLTLQQLVDEELLDPPPLRTTHEIGDDGTGHAAQVLGWMHINCGVSCHNDNRNADGYPSEMRLKLEGYLLDGRPSDDFPVRRNIVDADTKTSRWGEDKKRIAPGDPEDSLIYQLITSRAGPREQMPPIATQVLDSEHNAAVRDWILALE